MNFLLGTDVISEWVKSQPDPHVTAWLAEADEDRTFLSVVSFAEIGAGIESLPDGRRRHRLAAWLAVELPSRFEGRILPIDRRIAETWAVLVAHARLAGVTLGAMDAFFAATAEVHGLTLVTRNVGDFAALGIPLLNPWQPPPPRA